MATNGSDGYVGETQESSDGCSPGDWADGRAYFYSRDYASRNDISRSIIEYNENVGRAFRVISSDNRRYKVLCVDSNCSFTVAFAYGRGFEPPHTFVPHTCDATRVDLASYEASRGSKSSYVAFLDSARQFVLDKGRDASPAEMQKKLTAEGRRLTYQTCVDACIPLKAQLFDEDRTQCQFMNPCVTMDEMTRLEKHHPLTVSKKRGRPKKSKRIESQAATEAFKKKRSNKCTTCGNYGHNKRTCKE
ncbi:unnamed protein product [Albugo candida]|uniref:CCHC-type domain-containing protein n=1 Tax=Albugo candida TaxID=65357 RepID=A0A024GKX7_9STRA|nr:unnamed protein product [Albugo candida]|eukprot:CCI46981.1 unnamed protein product [Albugo candida]